MALPTITCFKAAVVDGREVKREGVYAFILDLGYDDAVLVLDLSDLVKSLEGLHAAHVV